jgi:hypothetical protein
LNEQCGCSQQFDVGKARDGERLRFCAGESIATPLRRAETDSFD